MRLHEPFSDAQLSDYVDRALPLFASLRVRLHLHHCTECQEALARIQRLGTLAQAWHGDARSPWSSHISSASRSSSGLFWRSTSYGAIATLAALTLFLVLRPHVSPREGLTFGDLVYAMEKVHTARWVQTITDYEKVPAWDKRSGGPLEMRYTMQREHFARLDPPAIAERPGKGAPVESYIHLTDLRGAVAYSPDSKQWRFTPRRETASHQEKMLREYVARSIFTPNSKNFPTSAGMSPPWSSGAASDWQTQQVIVEGKDLLELRRESRGKRYKITYRILADPLEKRVIRTESRQFDARDNRLEAEIVNDQFRYNEPPPPGVFDLKPPARAKVIRGDRRSPGIWPSLSTRERAEISHVIAASDSAWRAGDFTALARVWDFDYLARLLHATATGAERRRNWQRLTSAQQRRWQSWQSLVQTAYRQRTVAWTDSYLPQGEPDLLAVTVQTRIGWQEPEKGARKQTEETSAFYLRRVPSGGWRIVYWKYPEDDVIFRVHARQIKTLPPLPLSK